MHMPQRLYITGSQTCFDDHCRRLFVVVLRSKWEGVLCDSHQTCKRCKHDVLKDEIDEVVHNLTNQLGEELEDDGECGFVHVCASINAHLQSTFTETDQMEAYTPVHCQTVTLAHAGIHHGASTPLLVHRRTCSICRRPSH